MAPIAKDKISEDGRSNSDKYAEHFEVLNQYSEKIRKTLRLSILEVAFIVLFIFNFIVARILHYTSQEEEVFNYYNDKRNLLNQWFVKKGWGWTTLIILIFYGIVIKQSKTNKIQIVKNAGIRYLLVTGWWILFTQWCFGLPIMDKIFIWTGGKCTNIDSNKLKAFKGVTKIFTLLSTTPQESGAIYESTGVTSYTCRRLKGQWSGGHDPSGHVFLLVHSSLYLFFEAAPYFHPVGEFWKDLKKIMLVVRHDQAQFKNSSSQFISKHPYFGVVSLISLWWYMLFMTNMYFHLSAEKSVGLMFGYFGALVVFYLPRWLQSQ